MHDECENEMGLCEKMDMPLAGVGSTHGATARTLEEWKGDTGR
jgi:hypothetical protein